MKELVFRKSKTRYSGLAVPKLYVVAFGYF